MLSHNWPWIPNTVVISHIADATRNSHIMLIPLWWLRCIIKVIQCFGYVSYPLINKVHILSQNTHEIDMAPTTVNSSHLISPATAITRQPDSPSSKTITKCLPMECLHNQIPPSKQILLLSQNIHCALTHLTRTPTCNSHNYQIHPPIHPNLSHILTNLFAYTLDHIFLIQYYYTSQYPCHFHSATLLQEHLVVYAQHMGRYLTAKTSGKYWGHTGLNMGGRGGRIHPLPHSNPQNL